MMGLEDKWPFSVDLRLGFRGCFGYDNQPTNHRLGNPSHTSSAKTIEDTHDGKLFHLKKTMGNP